MTLEKTEIGHTQLIIRKNPPSIQVGKRILASYLLI